MNAKGYIIIILLFAHLSGWCQRKFFKEADSQIVSVVSDTGKIHATINYSKRDVKAKHQDRLYYSYNVNQIRQMEAGINGLPLHGKYKEYYVDKSLKISGNFKKGLKHGVWKKWSPNGNLEEVCRWRSGVRSSWCKSINEQKDTAKKVVKKEVKVSDSTATEKIKKKNTKQKIKGETKVKEAVKSDKKKKSLKTKKKEDKKPSVNSVEESEKKKEGKKKLPKKGWRMKIFKKNQECPEIEEGNKQ